MIQSSGQSTREGKKGVQAGWSGRRQASGVICDMIEERMKGRIYKKVGRPAMMYALENVALTKRQVEDLKMLRFSLD